MQRQCCVVFVFICVAFASRCRIYRVVNVTSIVIFIVIDIAIITFYCIFIDIAIRFVVVYNSLLLTSSSSSCDCYFYDYYHKHNFRYHEPMLLLLFFQLLHEQCRYYCSYAIFFSYFHPPLEILLIAPINLIVHYFDIYVSFSPFLSF